MLACFDLDGAIDSDPRQCQSLMSALRAAGQAVFVVTGNDSGPPTAADKAQKTKYLASLGCDAYDSLVLLDGSDPKALPRLKAAFLAKNHADCFFDNSEANCEAAAAAGVPFVCLIYPSREGGKVKGRAAAMTIQYRAAKDYRGPTPASKAKFVCDLADPARNPTAHVAQTLHRCHQWAASVYPAGLTYGDVKWVAQQCVNELKKRDPKSEASMDGFPGPSAGREAIGASDKEK